MRILGDPATNSFSNWLKGNGVYLAISVAIILLLVVIILFILSKNKNR